MAPKSRMLLAMTTTWMLAAVTCAALPFLYAVPQLKSMGQYMPLIVALVVGAAAAFPLSFVARRLCDLGSSPKISWASFSAGQAGAFGVIGWGVPMGLMFAVNEFMKASELWVVIPAVVIWPVAGVAFGLTMRWFARSQEQSS